PGAGGAQGSGAGGGGSGRRQSGNRSRREGAVIRGMHGLFYSSDPEATRAFFREKLKLGGGDIGEGWWIFDLAEGDLGIHPVEDPGEAGGEAISFYCDDVRAAVAELKAQGVAVEEVADRGWGLVTSVAAPGGVKIQLYQPRYSKP